MQKVILSLLTLFYCFTISYAQNASASEQIQNSQRATSIQIESGDISFEDTRGSEDKLSSGKLITRSKPAPFAKDPNKPIKELSLYPNPSFGQIFIELTFETLQINLFDVVGHNLGDVSYILVEDELVSIDLSDLPPSTYIVQLRHEEGVDTQKIVIVGE